MDDETKRELEDHAKAVVAESQSPTDEEIFKFLRSGTWSLIQICNNFNRSPAVIEARLDEMEAKGFHLVRSSGMVDASAYARQVVTPAVTLADLGGSDVALGFISDIHAGSRHSQPSGVLSVARTMVEEYGVRHIVQPGDITAGQFIYRGQEEDLLLEARPPSRAKAWVATDSQVWLAEQYIPKFDGVTWYTMGGNHDWSHVVAAGKDPVRMLVDRREDLEFLGYDAAGLWITDKVYVRVWHPRGSIPYAKSYRLQKGLESLAVSALKNAISKEANPVTSLLVAGHLHIVIWMPELPLAGLHAGCFEAQTSLGKRLGLEPALGGCVVKFRIADNGRVQRLEFTWLAIEEIKDDWRNFPVPESDLTDYDQEYRRPIFQGAELPASGNPHGEVVGGR